MRSEEILDWGAMRESMAGGASCALRRFTSLQIVLGNPMGSRREGGKGRGKKMTKQSCGLEEGGRASKKRFRERAREREFDVEFADPILSRRRSGFVAKSSRFIPFPPVLASLSADASSSSSSFFSPHVTKPWENSVARFFVSSPSKRWGCWRRNCQEGVRLAY